MGMTWTKAIGCRKHSRVTIQTECADGPWQRKKRKKKVGRFQFLLYFFIHSKNTKAACTFTLRHKRKVERLAQMFSVKLSNLVEILEENNSMDQSVLFK